MSREGEAQTDIYLQNYKTRSCKFVTQKAGHKLCTAYGLCVCMCMHAYSVAPQWGAADAEIKVPSGENTELKRSPFQALSRSVYSHTCYAYCQGFLSFLLISTLPVHSPAFFPKPLPKFFLCLLWLTHGSCVGPQNRIVHPAGCRFPCWVPAEY